MTGKLFGIGVGPGDPELITIKAVRYIRKSDVIFLPAATREECYAYEIASHVIPDIASKEIVCKIFPMTRDKEKLAAARKDIFAAAASFIYKGKNVAFLTIGDPTIYSTCAYIHKQAVAEGIESVMINGVPSFCAVAATLGISLADSSQEIHIIPGSYDVRETMELGGTRVYMKSGKKLAELKEALEEAPERENLEIYAVSNCGMPNEKITRGLERLETDSGYLTVVIIKERVTN